MSKVYNHFLKQREMLEGEIKEESKKPLPEMSEEELEEEEIKKPYDAIAEYEKKQKERTVMTNKGVMPKGVIAQSRGDTPIRVVGRVIDFGASYVRIEDPEGERRIIKDPVTGAEREVAPGKQFIAHARGEYTGKEGEVYSFYCTQTINIKEDPNGELYADPIFGLRGVWYLKR